MRGVALTILMLSLGSCNEEVDLSSSEINSGAARSGQDQQAQKNVVSETLLKEVGPIAVPFTLNKKNDPVTTVVAEGETRILTMQLETADTEETHEEEVHSEQFKQPWIKASEITETLAIANKGIVDILLIIDDSDSMQNVHKKLKSLVSGNNLKLLKGIENSSWQLAIADTRKTSACMLALVTENNVGDYVKTLEKIEAVKELDHHEGAVPKLRSAVTGGCLHDGKNWLRNNSTLAVIVATDEDHQCNWKNSTGSTGDGNSYDCGVTGIRAGIQSVRTGSGVSALKLYGIMDDTNTCGGMRNDTTLDQSIRDCYAKNADMSKCKFTNPCAAGDKASGSIRTGADDFKFRSATFAAIGFDIKDIFRSDYAGIFSDIIKDIKPSLQDRFLLQATPETGTLTVKQGGADLVANTDYELSSNVLTIKGQALTDLEDGKDLSVTYRVKDSPAFLDEFTIDSKADMDTVVVSINGVDKVKDTDYSITGNTIALIGNSQADKEKIFPEQAQARVQYRHKLKHYPDLVLKQPDIDANSVVVYVNNVSTQEFTLDKTTVQQLDSQGNTVDVDMPTVIFNKNHWPPHEQIVRISYTYYTTTEILSYNDNMPEKYSVTSYSCEKSEDGTPIPCSHANGMIIFSSNDFERDLEVVVNLTVEGLAEGRVLVPANLVANSLLLTKDGEDACDRSALVIEEDVINLTSDQAKQRCPFLANWNPDGGEDIKLSYQTYTPNQEVEVINSEILSYTGSYSNERWDVYIGTAKKKEGDDYTVSGRTITFKGQLAAATQGKVNVYLNP